MNTFCFHFYCSIGPCFKLRIWVARKGDMFVTFSRHYWVRGLYHLCFHATSNVIFHCAALLFHWHNRNSCVTRTSCLRVFSHPFRPSYMCTVMKRTLRRRMRKTPSWEETYPRFLLRLKVSNIVNCSFGCPRLYTLRNGNYLSMEYDAFRLLIPPSLVGYLFVDLSFPSLLSFRYVELVGGVPSFGAVVSIVLPESKGNDLEHEYVLIRCLNLCCHPLWQKTKYSGLDWIDQELILFIRMQISGI